MNIKPTNVSHDSPEEIAALVGQLRETQEKLRQREATLLSSAQHYHALFENMLEGYAHCRLLYDEASRATDYVYHEVNRAFEPQTGLKDVAGRKVSEVVPGMHEANPEQLEIYSRVARTGQPEQFETYAKQIDTWFSVSVYSNEPEHFSVVFENITHQKRAEAALRESEARFRGTFEQAAVGIAHVSSEGRFLRVNDKLCAILGYAREELLGVNFAALTVPEDLAPNLEARRAMLAGEVASYSVEKRYRRKHGDIVWIKLVTTPQRGATGEVEYFISVFADITERQQAEARLHRLNRLHTVLSRVGETIVRTHERPALFDAICQIVVEHGLLRMALIVEADLGATTTRIVASAGTGLEYLDEIVVTTDGGVHSQGTMGTALRTGIHDFCNDFANDPRMIPWRDRARQYGFLSTASFPFKLGERTIGALVLYAGEPGYFQEDELRLMVAVANDVSFALEAQLKEERRQLAESALQASEQQFASTFDSAAVGAALLAPEGRFLKVNGALCQLLGYSPAELTARTFQEVTYPEDLEASVVKVGQLLAGVVKAIQVEKRYIHQSGHLIWALSSVSLVRDAAGEPLHLIAQVQDVGERKQAEIALRESEERFRLISTQLTKVLDSSQDMICTFDAAGRFLQVSAACEAILGYRPEELLGTPCIDMVLPEDRALTEACAVAVMAGHPTRSFENRYLRRDGSIASIMWSARWSEADQSMFCVARDHSEARQAQAETQALAERLTTTLESLTDGFFTVDRDWRFTYINEEGEKLFRRPRAELLGRIAWEVFPEAEGTPFHQEYERALRENVAVQFEAHYPTDRWFEVRAYPSEQGLAVYFHDVSEQRAAREALRRSEERIVEQAALIDKAQDAIIVRDLRHRITYWNKSAERLYGWTAEEVMGRSARELFYPEPAIFDDAMDQLVERNDWTGEISQQTKTGASIIVESRWTLVHQANGHPRSVLVINTDITERKKIEQQFLRTQRMESIGTLAGGIAHDLNNVLGPIIMALDLLRLRFPDPASQDLLNIVANSARHGADMVGQVLSFARGVEGRRMEVQIKHLVGGVEKIANDTFLKHIRVQTIVPHDLWTVLGDPTQLHQVLLNLAVNARDAMPNGGTLTISAENLTLDGHYAGLNPEAQPGPYVALEVEDTGTGMPPGVIEKIFDPFFTTKELGKGTGLGLSTSLAIVKSHHGFLRVYSEPGQGTTFKVYIPAQTEASAATALAAKTEMPRGRDELILVVDDESSVRQITRQTLEAFGYRVLVASDGVEAIDLYTTRGPEIAVVLTDMMMPIMDGPATIHVLRNINPAVRIICASGLPANSQIAESASLGVKHFLPKPYTAETLLKVLRQVLATDH